MRFGNFDEAIRWATVHLMAQGEYVDTGTWQGYPTQGKPDLMTKEVLNLQLEVPVDRAVWESHPEHSELVGAREIALSFPDELTPRLQEEIKPNLPWADDHFAERVSRDPSNPGEEYLNWPWWKGQDAQSMAGKVFDHTYQERFWPKKANTGNRPHAHNRQPIWGIRYTYGDLDDVVKLLDAQPYTRQATFPIFFPEDTGASFGGRIPCTLHYHFMFREHKLHMWYPIRSCDLVRHFRDDLYMACKLMLWVITELQDHELRGDSPQLWVDARPGTLHFTAYSFHVHKGDLHHVQS